MTNNNLVYLYRELRELKDILERLEDKHNTIVSSLEKNNNIMPVKTLPTISPCIEGRDMLDRLRSAFDEIAKRAKEEKKN